MAGLGSRTLDVGLRGARPYVQGTQILGRTLDWLGEEKSGDVELQSAKFSRITIKSVVAIAEQTELPANVAFEIGSAVFSCGGSSYSIRFFESAADNAPHIEEVPSPIRSIENTSDERARPCGVARFETTGTGESILAAVVAVVKQIHQDIGAGVQDVWFTALMKARIKTVFSEDSVAGKITVKNVFVRRAGDRIQTLSKISVHFDSGQIMDDFLISFSYKDEGSEA